MCKAGYNSVYYFVLSDVLEVNNVSVILGTCFITKLGSYYNCIFYSFIRFISKWTKNKFHLFGQYV